MMTRLDTGDPSNTGVVLRSVARLCAARGPEGAGPASLASSFFNLSNASIAVNASIGYIGGVAVLFIPMALRWVGHVLAPARWHRYRQKFHGR